MFGTKYNISYNSLAGDVITVAFMFAGYAGAVTQLIGGPSPVVIEHDFKLKEFPADPVTDTKMTINISQPTFPGNFYNDITNINDGDCWVVYYNATQNIKQSGWLIPDESHRKFNTYNYNISLTIISPLSFMKAKSLLADDGKMLYDKYFLSELITTCLKRSLPADVAPVYVHNSAISENSSGGNAFAASKIKIEGLNTSEGKPPTCYDVIKHIASSFGCKVTWANDTLYFDNLYYKAGQAANTTIAIKANETDNFLIGNTEDVTKERGVNEVSTRYEYSYTTGILKNGLFSAKTGDVFSDWDYGKLYNGSTIIRHYTSSNVTSVGSGRKHNPYSIRFENNLGSWLDYKIFNNETVYQGLGQKVNVKSGDVLKLAVKYGYKHWRIGALENHPTTPYLVIAITMKDPASPNDFSKIMTVADVSSVEGDKEQDIFIKRFSSAPTLPKWFPPFDFIGGAKYLQPIEIGIESKDGVVQHYEKDLGSIPFTGELMVMILGVAWNTPPSSITGANIFVDIRSLILSSITPNAGNKNATGEENYLTNNSSFKARETSDLKLANFLNEGVAGNLFNSAGTNSTGYNGMTLQKQIVKQMMALNRSPRFAADVDVKSRGLKATDLLELKEGLNELLPNKYLIARMITDTRSCEHQLSVYELKAENKNIVENAEPDAANDLYETYKIQ